MYAINKHGLGVFALSKVQFNVQTALPDEQNHLRASLHAWFVLQAGRHRVLRFYNFCNPILLRDKNDVLSMH
ncbi:hypothetical protein B5F71_07035 [Bacteroides sp. An269]|nr:hypothetical protein B5F71_07035 [Bacteroides sp. An269]